VPMHGAAHTRNAPPSSTPEPLGVLEVAIPAPPPDRGIFSNAMNASRYAKRKTRRCCVWVVLRERRRRSAAASLERYEDDG